LYPSPPARALYLISKGKPSDPAIISFLQFILSEGQNFIAEAGYVQLEGTMLEQGRTKLNISK
jgi:phosphate transport system substrate-binding protein